MHDESASYAMFLICEGLLRRVVELSLGDKGFPLGFDAGPVRRSQVRRCGVCGPIWHACIAICPTNIGDDKNEDFYPLKLSIRFFLLHKNTSNFTYSSMQIWEYISTGNSVLVNSCIFRACKLCFVKFYGFSGISSDLP